MSTRHHVWSILAVTIAVGLLATLPLDAQQAPNDNTAELDRVKHELLSTAKQLVEIRKKQHERGAGVFELLAAAHRQQFELEERFASTHDDRLKALHKQLDLAKKLHDEAKLIVETGGRVPGFGLGSVLQYQINVLEIELKILQLQQTGTAGQ